MTSTLTARQADCPYADRHGNDLGYCPWCHWTEEAPTPSDSLGELTTLILGKTATAAAAAVLAAGYVKSSV